MKVIGLLSTKEEAEELKYIAQVCSVENRIRFVAHIQKLKKIIHDQQA